jgi:hypothetical protein
MSLNKDVSTIQEKSVARVLGGKLTPGSGAASFAGGDVLTDSFLIECKTTTKPLSSFSVKKEWLDKAKEQSFEQGKDFYALAFRFEPDGDDHIVIPIEIFKELLDCKDNLADNI